MKKIAILWLMSNVIYMPEKEKTNLIKFYQP